MGTHRSTKSTRSQRSQRSQKKLVTGTIEACRAYRARPSKYREPRVSQMRSSWQRAADRKVRRARQKEREARQEREEEERRFGQLHDAVTGLGSASTSGGVSLAPLSSSAQVSAYLGALQ